MRGGLADSWTLRAGRSPTVLVSTVAIGGIVASAMLVSAVRGTEGSELRRLAGAVGPHRVTRARLTGGFAYAPCDTAAPNDSLIAGLACPGAPPAEWEQAAALSKVAAEMRAAGALGSGSASRRHATGSWHLVWGDAGAAVDELRAAARLDPADARIRSDLAAAFLARAEREQDPRWILDAYDAADSALALDPRLAEARFNRAVALEWLYLRNDAMAAWAFYLELDASSRWAGEARDHLRQLRVVPREWPMVRREFQAAVLAGRDSVVRDFARRFPARVREEARHAAVEWARASEAGAPRADTLLAASLTVARALGAVTGDSLWSDAMGALVATPERGDGTRRAAVARGLLAYDRGDAFLDQFALDSAESWFRESYHSLASAANAAQYWPAFGLAAVAYSRQSPRGYAQALIALRALLGSAPDAYRVVRGLAARTEGVIYGIGANFGSAIAAYSAATREGRGTGDPGLELRPHANLAGNYANLGDGRAAWVHLYHGIRSAPRFAEASRDMQRVFMRAADLSADRSPRAASLFQGEAIRLASGTSETATDSMVMIAALRREAELLARQGLTAPALRSVAKARAYIARVRSDSVRAVSTADVDLVEGQAWLAERSDSAVRVLRRVVDRYRDTQYFRQVARAELLLANAYAASGAMDSAQRSFEAALVEVERRRATIVSPEERARFLDQARPVIDTLVRFLAGRGDTLGALEFLERMRGRVLLERVQEGSADPRTEEWSASTVRHTLPPRTSIISYAALGEELVAWVIRRDGVSMYRTPITTDLEHLTSRFSALLVSRAGGAEARAIAEQLHRLVITPVVDGLEPSSRLVIVPDRWLHFVPFAALVDPATGRFLVETFEINVVPSVQLYAQSAVRYDELRQIRSRSVLAVGNPSFDARMFSLPRLPGAEREARRVASFYDQADVLVDTQATKSAFLRAAAAANVIHFAGHGVVRSDAPSLSYLVLAPDDSGRASGALTAQELFARRLPTTRLAILSGCQTASGRLSDTEGASSLARAFFAAGVPAVVASLWAVEDQSTAEFFADYHRALSRGADPTTALRQTQLEWLAREKGDWSAASTWAAFTLFGATTGRAPEGWSAEHRVSRSKPQ